MRILYSHRIQSQDGQGVHIEELVRALREAGHEVLVVGPRFFEQAAFGGESSLVARIRKLLPGALGELAEMTYNFPAYLDLRRAWRSFRPDFVYERCNLYFLAGSWLAKRHGATVLLEVNAPLAEERGKFGGLHLGWLAARLERWTWRSATRVLPVTSVLGDMLVAAGVERARVCVVPNGIDLARFPAQSEVTPDVVRDVVTLGFVGFVRPWHGLDRVIEGMARSPERGGLRLVVVGDGPARPDLEALAARLGIAGLISFTGLVQPKDVPGVVMGFDIALQPSATEYASPLKIFDYMAAGCAIVAPDQPNLREVLEDGRNASLFDPAQEGAMWEAVAGLIAEPALRRRLGETARADLEGRDYTWAGNARRVARIAADARGEASLGVSSSAG